MEQIKPQKYNTAGMEDYLFFTWIQMLQEKLKTYRANRRSELLGIQFRLGGILESLKRRHLSHIFFRVRRDEPISYVCTKHLIPSQNHINDANDKGCHGSKVTAILRRKQAKEGNSVHKLDHMAWMVQHAYLGVKMLEWVGTPMHQRKRLLKHSTTSTA